MSDKKIRLQKKRLSEVANIVANLPPEYRFNMEGWGYRLAGECGTVCCAIGAATLHKPFNRMGFSPADKNVLTPAYRKPGSLETNNSWEAVCNFFGLSEVQAYYLFSHTAYRRSPRRQTVARRIRRFVESSGYVPERFINQADYEPMGGTMYGI